MVETGNGAENLRDIKTYVYTYVSTIPFDEEGATLQLKRYLNLHRLAIKQLKTIGLLYVELKVKFVIGFALSTPVRKIRSLNSTKPILALCTGWHREVKFTPQLIYTHFFQTKFLQLERWVVSSLP
jgi:hypothetical protein